MVEETELSWCVGHAEQQGQALKLCGCHMAPASIRNQKFQ